MTITNNVSNPTLHCIAYCVVVLYLKMTRFILVLCVLLYSSSEDSTTDVSSSSDDTSSYNLTS